MWTLKNKLFWWSCTFPAIPPFLNQASGKLKLLISTQRAMKLLDSLDPFGMRSCMHCQSESIFSSLQNNFGMKYQAKQKKRGEEQGQNHSKPRPPINTSQQRSCGKPTLAPPADFAMYGLRVFHKWCHISTTMHICKSTKVPLKSVDLPPSKQASIMKHAFIKDCRTDECC